MGRPSHTRVALAKDLAQKWLHKHAAPEYRITAYSGSEYIKNLPNLLRAFRDGKVKIGGINPISDIGIEVGMDSVTFWSSNREGMLKLDSWLRKRGCETTGIW